MKYLSQEITIETYSKSLPNVIRFQFKGKFTLEASQNVCEAWSKEFEKPLKYSNYIMIWDCLQMDGFDLNARKEWARCLDRFANDISKVIVISKNVIIRGASHLMLKTYPFESSVIKSVDEIDLSNSQPKELAFEKPVGIL